METVRRNRVSEGKGMSHFSRLVKLFWISRPISWPNTSYPFLVGYIISIGGVPTGLDLVTLVVGSLYFIGPFNLLMYGVNDVYDYESDILNPRKGGIEGMRESRAFHPTILRAVVLTNAPFLLYLLIVSDWPARAVLALVVFAAIAYSLKGLRFKEVPILDSITSSFHFVGPLIFALALTGFPTAAWPWVGAFFLWGMASHALGAIQDILPDRKGGLHSIATALGARATIRLTVILYTLAVALAAIQGSEYWPIVIAGALYVANCIPYLHTTDETSAATNTAWKRFLWLNYLAGAIITIFIVATQVL